ncbi:MAG: hypothetical protein HP043_03215 [Dialister sp.]|nr:hypothetical protein [Dialister sp.]
MNNIIKVSFLQILLLFVFNIAYAAEPSGTEKQIFEKIRNGYQALIDYQKQYPYMTNPELVELPLQEFVEFSFADEKEFNPAVIQRLIDQINVLDQSGDTTYTLGYMIIRHINKHGLSLKNKRKILELLLENYFLIHKNDIETILFYNTFKSKECYSDISKNIIKQKLLTADFKKGSSLLIADKIDWTKDPAMLDFLTEKSKKCKKWKDNDISWFALLLLARNGNNEAIQKIVELSKIKLALPERKLQIYYMPAELSIIHSDEIVELLIALLDSSESYPAPGNPNKLNAAAAKALSGMIVDFPDLDYNKFNNSCEIELCKKWLKAHKHRTFKNSIPALIFR